MITRTTPSPLLSAVDDAGETLRKMRHQVERDDRYQDEALAADLTAAIDALMRYRLARQRVGRESL